MVRRDEVEPGDGRACPSSARKAILASDIRSCRLARRGADVVAEARSSERLCGAAAPPPDRVRLRTFADCAAHRVGHRATRGARARALAPPAVASGGRGRAAACRRTPDRSPGTRTSRTPRCGRGGKVAGLQGAADRCATARRRRSRRRPAPPPTARTAASARRRGRSASAAPARPAQPVDHQRVELQLVQRLRLEIRIGGAAGLVVDDPQLARSARGRAGRRSRAAGPRRRSRSRWRTRRPPGRTGADPRG